MTVSVLFLFLISQESRELKNLPVEKTEENSPCVDEASMQIIDEERLKNFLSYMEGGGPFRDEPQGTVGVVEKSDTTKESVSSGKPDCRQKAASSERTEGNAAEWISGVCCHTG